jgi:hypothetical protein
MSANQEQDLKLKRQLSEEIARVAMPAWRW